MSCVVRWQGAARCERCLRFAELAVLEKPAQQLDADFDQAAQLRTFIEKLLDSGVDPTTIRVYTLTPTRVRVEPRVVSLYYADAFSEGEEAACAHEAWEQDSAGRRVRCADCGVSLRE